MSVFYSTFARLSSLAILGLVSFVVYQLGIYIYNVFFHPLRKFPGPSFAAASYFPKIRESLNGNYINWTVEQHLKYGEVVRTSPHELSFSGADSWKDIYGHPKAGQPTLAKDRRFYETPGSDDVVDIVCAKPADHSRQRRIFSHAFSDRALKMQEPLFLTYVDKLMQKMRATIETDPQHKFNMVNMYNFTTFDIMGDLTFGEPLDMLEDSGYHPWVASIFAGFRFGSYLHCIRSYPTLEKLLLGAIPQSIKDQQKQHHSFSTTRVDRRLEKKNARPDIWGLVIEKEGESGLTLREMYANSNIFMLAGTETTATLLSGLTWHLLKNPSKLDLLTREIRLAFARDQEITIERLQQLKYLQACIEEGLRMFPPVSNGLPRVVPSSGIRVADQDIPPGATVFVTALAAYRNPNNFKDASSFIPERWLSDEYASDKKHALQPFSTGPRACLGKNMAYHEIRLILSKLLWNFDLKLCTESDDWASQKIFIMWDKGPLYCTLVPAY